jgi:hypothetical protein
MVASSRSFYEGGLSLRILPCTFTEYLSHFGLSNVGNFVSALPILTPLEFVKNHRNQSAPPVERSNPATALAPSTSGTMVVSINTQKTNASLAQS